MSGETIGFLCGLGGFAFGFLAALIVSAIQHRPRSRTWAETTMLANAAADKRRRKV